MDVKKVRRTVGTLARGYGAGVLDALLGVDEGCKGEDGKGEAGHVVSAGLRQGLVRRGA